MTRITVKDLRIAADRLNKLTDSPMYYREGGNIQVGHWHIDCAYGGYSLVRTSNESGGVSHPMGHAGCQSARELHEQINAFIKGIEFVRFGE